MTTAVGASPATERSGIELLDAEDDADMVESQEVATTSIRLKKLQIQYSNGNGEQQRQR